MASFSAFGFSGWDPLGSFGQGVLSNYFGKKSAKQALFQQIGLAKWQAKNMPSWQKEGLIKAGYNPLLALDTVGSQALPSAFTGWMPSVGTDTVGGFDNQSFASQKAAKSLKQSEVSTARSAARSAHWEAYQREQNAQASRIELETLRDEASARQTLARVDELEALATLDALVGQEGYRMNSDDYFDEGGKAARHFSRGFLTKGKTGYDNLRRKIFNQIERDAFRNSKEHAMYEDTINAIHGFNDMGSAYEHWRNGRRFYSPGCSFYRGR